MILISAHPKNQSLRHVHDMKLICKVQAKKNTAAYKCAFFWSGSGTSEGSSLVCIRKCSNPCKRKQLKRRRRVPECVWLHSYVCFLKSNQIKFIYKAFFKTTVFGQSAAHNINSDKTIQNQVTIKTYKKNTQACNGI